MLALAAERAAARGSAVSAGDACTVAVAVGGLDGGWLTVMSDPARRELVYATSARAAGLEELQFALGEGPCVDAFASGSPVLVPELAASSWQVRWPGFTMEAGTAAVFAFPLASGAIRVGVLGLYRDAPGSLSPGALADVLVCADVALQLVLHSRAAADGDGAGWAHDRPAHNGWSDDHAQVYQATGMVSAQRGVGLEEALALLRAHAFAHDQALGEVAAAVVGRRLRLDSDDTGEPVP
jgi:GAF domain-containing protein/ANTAR domain-containing protein